MPTVGGKNVFPQIIPEPPATEPTPSSSIIVIHLGSLYLRIGRASDTFPHTLPQCIARRHKPTSGRDGIQQNRYEDSWLMRPETKHNELAVQQMTGLNAAHQALQSRPTSFGGCRRIIRADLLAEFNGNVRANMSEEMSSLHWTPVKHEPAYLIGQDALMINHKEPYNIHWPFRRGCFNLHSEPGGTLSAILQDIEDILATAMSTYLNISRSDIKLPSVGMVSVGILSGDPKSAALYTQTDKFLKNTSSIKNYRAVLLIPDIYRRRNVRDLVDLLLQRLGFEAAFVVQESVCATFGAGVSSACVVDVGDQKTSVCCVEDGLSQPLTRLVMQYGGSDMSRCFHWLLSRSAFPYRDCRLSRRMDALFMQDLKETYCHLEQDLQGIEETEIILRRPSQRLVKYSIRIGDERILTPLSAFFPDMFGMKGEHLFQKPEQFQSDSTDPFDDDYLRQTMSRHEMSARQRKKDAAVNQSQDNSIVDDIQMDDDDVLDPVDMGSAAGVKCRTEEEGDGVDTTHGLVGIHQAIIMSIDKCDSEEMKKRMFSCIVVVGGGLMFPSAQSWLQYLVWTNMPAAMRLALETMDIIMKPKDLDPRMTCWKGAAVMSCLDTANELWITRSEWSRHAVRVLRERAPFIW